MQKKNKDNLYHLGISLLKLTDLALQISDTLIESGSERGYLVRILASRPGVPGSNPIAAPKSLVGLRDLNQFYHIGTQHGRG